MAAYRRRLVPHLQLAGVSGSLPVSAGISDIDVITAVGRPDRWLRTAGESVAAFAAEVGVAVRWLVVSDGPDMGWIAEQIGDLPVPILAFPTPLGQTQRQGPARTRNRGLAHATAPTICALDSDDEYLPDAMADLYFQHLEEGLPWAAGRPVFVLPDGSLNTTIRPARLSEGVHAPDTYRSHALAHNYLPWHTCGTFISREVLLDVGGWDTSRSFVRAGDIAMMARVTRKHGGFFTHRPVMRYRQHPESLSHSTAWGPRDEVLLGVDLTDATLDRPEPSSGSFDVDLAASRAAIRSGIGLQTPRPLL